MRGATHALIGFVAGVFLAQQLDASSLDTLSLGAITAVAALLPDLDHPQATLRQRLGLVGDIAFFWVKHRGILHSLLALGIVAAVAIAALGATNKLTASVIIGYGSHLLADLLTPDGVPIFLPIYGKRIRLPLVRTGSLLETAFAGVLVMLAAWLLMR